MRRRVILGALPGLALWSSRDASGEEASQRGGAGESDDRVGARDLREFGARGDGRTDDSAAFSRWLRHLHRTGATGALSAGHYVVERASAFDVRGMIRIMGAGADRCVLDGGARGSRAPGLFRLFRGTLDISGVTTRDLMLAESFECLEADVDLLRLKDWRWENVRADAPRALTLLSPSGAVLLGVERLHLENIAGRGGAAGLCIQMPVTHADVANVVILDIETPDGDRWFKRSDPKAMMGSGTATGLLLGHDSRVAQQRAVSWRLDKILVDGVRDRRVPRQHGRGANCDGVRIIGRNITIGRLDVKRVSNASKRDCCGVYLKAKNLHTDTMKISDAGHHEASLTLKGDVPGYGETAEGGQIVLRSVEIRNTEGFVGRPAAYLRCRNLEIGTLLISGCGGDVEDPLFPGGRIEGASCVVRTSPPLRGGDLGSLTIGRLELTDCVLGGVSARWAIGLAGYSTVSIASLECVRLRNSGRFTGVGAQDIAVLAFTGVETNRCDLGFVRVSESATEGRACSGIVVMKQARLGDLNIDTLVADETLTDVIVVTGELGALRWRAGDVKEVSGNAIVWGERARARVHTGHVAGLQ